MRRAAWILGVAVAGCTSAAPARDDVEESPDCKTIHVAAEITAAAGTYEHETQGDGGTASGDGNGGYARVLLDFSGSGKVGGGVALEGAGSNGELIDDPANTRSRGHATDAFAYVALRHFEAEDGLSVPLRVGPYLHEITLDDDANSRRTDWDGVGLRVEFAPRYWLSRANDVSFALVGDASGGVHLTDIEQRSAGAKDRFDGDGWTLGAEFGVEALFGRRFATRLTYLYRSTREAKSDASQGVEVPQSTSSFRGVALTLAIRF